MGTNWITIVDVVNLSGVRECFIYFFTAICVSMTIAGGVEALKKPIKLGLLAAVVIMGLIVWIEFTVIYDIHILRLKPIESVKVNLLDSNIDSLRKYSPIWVEDNSPEAPFYVVTKAEGKDKPITVYLHCTKEYLTNSPMSVKLKGGNDNGR